MTTNENESAEAINEILGNLLSEEDKLAGGMANYRVETKKITISQCANKQIPEELIKYAKAIFHLEVDQNELKEESYEIIGQLGSLKELKLDKVGDKLPASGLKSLKLEKLTINNYSDNAGNIFPDWIGNMDSLIELDLTYTRFSELPIELVMHLESLNISYTEIRELPEQVSPLFIKHLNLSNTNIVHLPDCYITSSLVYLDISSSKIKGIERRLPALTKLMYFNCSNTETWDLPEGDYLNNLAAIDISDTKIKQLPEGLKNLRELKYIGLQNCKLKTLSSEVVLQFMNNGLKFKTDNAVWREKNNLKPEEQGVFIRGMTLVDMDVRYLTYNRRDWMVAFYNEPNKVLAHEVGIMVVGEAGVGKTTVINRLLGCDYGEDLLVDAGGFKTVDNAMGVFDDFRRKLGHDVHFNIMEMSGEPGDFAVHPIFFVQATIYIVVLDAQREERIYQEALYWVKLLQQKTYAPTILFALTHVNALTKKKLDVSLLQNTTPFFFTEESIIYIAEETFEEKDRELQKSMIKIIEKQPSYTIEVPESWKRIGRHVENLLAQRRVIDSQRMKYLRQFYGSPPELAFWNLIWLSENGYGYANVNTTEAMILPEYMYENTWHATGLYSIVRYAGRKAANGMVRENMTDYYRVFDDWSETITDSTQSYSRENYKTMLGELIKHRLCFTHKEEYHFPLCKSIVSDSDTYMNWAIKVLDFSNVNHYVVRFPVLSEAMLSFLIVEIAKLFIDYYHVNGTTADPVEYMSFGREGIALSLLPQDGGVSLHMQGVIGSPSELHIYASSVQRTEFKVSVQPEHLKYAFSLAWQAIANLFGTYEWYSQPKGKAYIELKSGDNRTLVGLDELEDYIKAGRSEYFLMSATFKMNELQRRYLPEPWDPLRVLNNKLYQKK